MKAIELKSKTNQSGRLKIDLDLNVKNSAVRVLILMDESEEEQNWATYALKNEAFDFLKEPEEDIYSIQDGKPFND
ncbi:MAG: hypothetical protein KKE39_02485 [Bacteroidetes bacterium]|nr:hypothetical protein [Bacteroidota bacterium]MBU1371200.1 hypothetical protein [Bacteroidota bacterium]MBU1483777.1 hypothetical protein [Bacteroidota bacterium]MBU1760779.1 hypothetical protein [Bacteroidota bacterium]MBU2046673.1 hypothetical protein [Bacteroidota bacterium]